MEERNGGENLLPEGYLNNENPFAFACNYERDPYNQVDIKMNITATQRMQSVFIPVDQDTPSVLEEKEKIINSVKEEAIRSLLEKGMAKLGYKTEEIGAQPEEFLMKRIVEGNYEDNGLVDIMLEIKQIKLSYKQKILRDGVYNAVHGILSPDQILSAVMYKRPKNDYLMDLRVLEKLEMKYLSHTPD
jgi:hypothetical protein